jgi:diguanylate cyclase (GGDEF)-like protein
MKPADLLAAMQRTVEQLGAFNEIAKALTSTLEVGEVLQLVMQKVSALLKPRNWSLLLFDEKSGQLYFEIVVGEGAERLHGMRIPPGEGIAGAVYSTGEPRLVHDVGNDPTYARRFEAVSGFATRSVIAVPLKARGRTLGVMELVTGADQPNFTPEDMQAALGMSDYVAIAIDNARNFQRVQDLTLTDEHTGLFNARHLRALLDVEVARSLRFHHPLSLIFLDLDRFKSVNDTYGHLVGSALLKEVGQRLLGCVRQVDSVFRFGGDEFALLLIETGVEGAQVIGERLCAAIREHRFMRERGLAIELSISVGIATLPDHTQTAIGLLESSDAAMYAAKEAGRDQVCVSGALPTPLHKTPGPT